MEFGFASVPFVLHLAPGSAYAGLLALPATQVTWRELYHVTLSVSLLVYGIQTFLTRTYHSSSGRGSLVQEIRHFQIQF